MPVPGYDPDDLDDALASLVDDEDVWRLLDDEEWAAYRGGDSLVDVLDESQVRALLDERDANGE